MPERKEAPWERKERLRQAMERGRRALALLESPGWLEFLEDYPQRRRLELLEQLKLLGSLDRDQIVVATLAIKAGIEEADHLRQHLAGVVAQGQEAAFELEQSMATDSQEEF